MVSWGAKLTRLLQERSLHVILPKQYAAVRYEQVVACDPTITLQARLLYIQICACADIGDFAASTAELTHYTGRSKRTVRRLLSELREHDITPDSILREIRDLGGDRRNGEASA